MQNNNAIIITIGDELLIGQTIDTNSAWMAKRLNEIGIDVVKRIAVGDNKKEIINALDDALINASLILITGGLGPTADDITKPLLCEYFGGNLTVNDEALENVKAIFGRRKLPLLEVNKKQAEVPDNCKVVQNHFGTAPGMWFEKDGRITISMPGVPHEMMGMMERDVLPFLQKTANTQSIVHRHIITAGIGESFLAQRISVIESSLPKHIKLAYLPGNWIIKLRLTAKGKDESKLLEEATSFQKQIRNELQEFVIALDDQPLESFILESFLTKGKTLALAESCTGGYIGHALTQVENSSKYYAGSIVCYNNDIKQKILDISEDAIHQRGVVSEEIAMMMAANVKNILGTDVGFGITGWLGETDDDAFAEKGIVWMAICDGKKVFSKKFHFPYDRAQNKEVALQMALVVIWKFINEKKF